MHVTTEFWRNPSMPFIEARRSSNSRACYKPHAHPTVSIGAVDAGKSVLIDAGNVAKQLLSNAVVWIPAFHRHACNPLPSTAWSYQMLFVEPRWIAEVYGNLQVSPFSMHESRGIQVSHDPGLYAHVNWVNQLLFSDASVERKRGALIALLHICQATHWDNVLTSPRPPHAVTQSLQHVLERLQSDPSLELDWNQEAQDAGMSRTQFIRAFRRVTGMTPHAWQMNLRINAARDLIRQGSSLAEAAYAQGFADQAHFQRVFKGLAGTTPGNYRA